jgi:hypothetical protein
MNGKLRTHEDFVNDVKLIFPDLEIISKFTMTNKKVLVKNKFGVCNVYASCLLLGHEPTIKSAIDKNSYFKNKAFLVHGDKYDYSKVNYTIGENKVIVICKKHGDFLVSVQNHLQGSNCPTCGREHTTEVAKQQTTSWKYSDWEKAGLKSENFKCFKLYIVKMHNENEEFYKIGKTFNELSVRYRKAKLPYELELIYELCDDAKTISKAEETLKRINKEHKYLPKINFGGMHECFSQIKNLEEIKDGQLITHWDKIFIK